MANPWGKKNPMMSLALSAANAWAGAARGMWMGAAKRGQQAAAKTAMRDAGAFWMAGAAPKKTRGRRGKG